MKNRYLLVVLLLSWTSSHSMQDPDLSGDLDVDEEPRPLSPHKNSLNRTDSESTPTPQERISSPSECSPPKATSPQTKTNVVKPSLYSIPYRAPLTAKNLALLNKYNEEQSKQEEEWKRGCEEDNSYSLSRPSVFTEGLTPENMDTITAGLLQ
jgi:hypothetical protein